MNLTKLEIRRMPGVTEGFAFEPGPGLNVVVGPNGVGKTSAMTALRALLWPDDVRPHPVDVGATWQDGTQVLTATQNTAGRTSWQRDGAPALRPPLPDGRFAACFFPTLPELLTQPKGDDALAREIVRQLAGGYDVGKVRECGHFPAGKRYANELAALRAAEEEVRRLQGEQLVLSTDENGLPKLRDELAVARRARDRHGLLVRARQRLEAARDLDAAERKLGELPSGMDALREGDPARLERLRGEREKMLQGARDADALLARHDRQRAECRLDASVPMPLLATARADADRARELEAALGDIDRRRESERGAVAAIRADLGGWKASRPREALPALDAIERLLHRGSELAAERGRLDAERQSLAGSAPDEEPARRAAGILRAWLAAPEPHPVATRDRTVVVALVVSLLGLGLLVLVGGLGLAVLVHPGWLAAAVLGLVAMVAAAGAGAMALRPTAAPTDVRPDLERQLGALGSPPPRTWTRPDVEARLAELDLVVAEAASGRVRLDRQRSLDTQLRKADENAAAHKAELDRAREALGVDAGGALGLGVLADALRRLADAEAREGALAAERVALADAHARILAGLSDALSPFGGQVSRAAEAAGCVSDLESRSRDLQQALDGVAQATLARSTALDRAAALQAEHDQVLNVAGVPDAGALASRVRLIPIWKAARAALEAARGALDAHDRALEGNPELGSLDEAALGDAIAAAESAATEAEALAERITGIATRVTDARKGRNLEDALSKLSDCQQVLLDAREDAYRAAAGRTLLDLLESDHERRSQPAVVQRAIDLFATFTHHKWKLQVERTGSFRAIDTAGGRGHALGELSEGTRAQLLLSVRLAFAGLAENGASAPFVLDDALSISDPDRFDAVVESLATLARTEGRQVFYLTSQPLDVARWRARAGDALRIIDLGAIRLGQAAVSADALRLPEVADIPAPDSDDASSYAARIQVPAFRVLRGADAQHPYYLLDDHLPLLHRLLQLRLGTVGAIRSLLSGSGSAALDGDLQHKLRRRLRWFDAFVDAWRIGRGRQVGRDQLQSVVSDRLIDRATTLATNLGGDARRLVEAMRDKQVKGMRTETIAELETWLETHGYLDARPVLSADEVRLRVLDAAQDPIQDGEELATRVGRWSTWASVAPPAP